jgi:hypothetical protein
MISLLVDAGMTNDQGAPYYIIWASRQRPGSWRGLLGVSSECPLDSSIGCGYGMGPNDVSMVTSTLALPAPVHSPRMHGWEARWWRMHSTYYLHPRQQDQGRHQSSSPSESDVGERLGERIRCTTSARMVAFLVACCWLGMVCMDLGRTGRVDTPKGCLGLSIMIGTADFVQFDSNVYLYFLLACSLIINTDLLSAAHHLR